MLPFVFFGLGSLFGYFSVRILAANVHLDDDSAFRGIFGAALAGASIFFFCLAWLVI
jgi:hypothetical protein